jgi:hypothetical protein
MQMYFYGFGTNWAWCYLPVWLWECSFPLVRILQFRYDRETWIKFTWVKMWNMLGPFAVYMELILPMTGFFSTRCLFLVPWQSPTWTIAFLFVAVRASLASIDKHPADTVTCICKPQELQERSQCRVQ